MKFTYSSLTQILLYNRRVKIHSRWKKNPSYKIFDSLEIFCLLKNKLYSTGYRGQTDRVTILANPDLGL